MPYLYNLFSKTAVLKIFYFCLFLKVQIYVSDAACSLISPNPTENKLLERLKPLNGHMFQTKDLNYTYHVSICSKMDGQDEGVGVIQFGSDKNNYTIGRYDKVEVVGGTNWMLLKYYEGSIYTKHCNNSEREAHIMIICDPDAVMGKLEIMEERKSSLISCFYLFELGSNVSCSFKPTTVTKGYSSGSVFCIVFFTFAILYLAVGFLYKRLVVGAKGLEQIPNYTFWKDFGNLQADGCDFLCRCGPRQESQAYRGIDDHLKMEDERDDQMLNM